MGIDLVGLLFLTFGVLGAFVPTAYSRLIGPKPPLRPFVVRLFGVVWLLLGSYIVLKNHEILS